MGVTLFLPKNMNENAMEKSKCVVQILSLHISHLISMVNLCVTVTDETSNHYSALEHVQYH